MPRNRKRTRNKLPTLSSTSMGGRRMYAAEFIEVVTTHALKHTVADAAAYYDLSERVVRQWTLRAKELNKQTAKMVTMLQNPYRGTAYNLLRRISLSDKLFAELEVTVEAERVRNGGHIPAPQLQKLITAYAMLVDKRRLEEGAHTALVQDIREPEDILKEGESRVKEFHDKFGYERELPSGNGREDEAKVSKRS